MWTKIKEKKNNNNEHSKEKCIHFKSVEIIFGLVVFQMRLCYNRAAFSMHPKKALTNQRNQFVCAMQQD